MLIRSIPRSRNFNPRAPCGARRKTVKRSLTIQRNFNPRAPCGARLPYYRGQGLHQRFQSTRPVRGATFQLCAFFGTIDIISIHAPRAGRDRKSVLSSVILFPFQSTRPVRGATINATADTLTARFQSTRPVRGATLSRRSTPRAAIDFNPRAPCGARQPIRVTVISPPTFQSTRPVRGATI